MIRTVGKISLLTSLAVLLAGCRGGCCSRHGHDHHDAKNNNSEKYTLTETREVRRANVDMNDVENDVVHTHRHVDGK